ncbi:hypothetical protein [Streptomyces nodosus]|nr:hypothetical protein [Streptomyces nodosus]
MEDAWPEEEPLKKGRTVARSGRLGPLAVGPGRIAAQVYDGADEPYTVVLGLPQPAEEQWDALWERTADRPAETEALLAGELPPDLLEAAEDARLGLLPGYGELEPDCGCDEPDHPCAHAVALGYQFSWLLDEEPQLLLLVRGRDWPTALEELKSVLLLRALAEGTEADDVPDAGDAEDTSEGADLAGGQPDELTDSPAAAGIPAAEAYTRPAAPLPALPPLPEPPDDDTEPVTGIEADPLEQLVADAAVRARELLAYILGAGGEPPRPLGRWQDTVRIAATHPAPRVPARLRDSCDRPEELDRAVEAWRWGGAAGLAVLEEVWQPEGPDVTRARTALSTGWEDEELPDLDPAGGVAEDQPLPFGPGEQGPQSDKLITLMAALHGFHVGEDVVASHLPQVVVAVRPLQQGRTDWLRESQAVPSLRGRLRGPPSHRTRVQRSASERMPTASPSRRPTSQRSKDGSLSSSKIPISSRTATTWPTGRSRARSGEKISVCRMASPST